MGNTTHSESIQPLQSVKLVYQPCSWSRAALEPLRNRWSLMVNDDEHWWWRCSLIITIYAIYYSCLPDYVFMGLWINYVATQLLKLWQLKAKLSQPVSAFWASWTPCYICWVRHVLTLALFFNYLLYFSIIWIKIPDGYQIARVWKN